VAIKLWAVFFVCLSQVAGNQGWDKGIDYIRMDGSTSAQYRKEWTEMFNDPENVKYVLCSSQRMDRLELPHVENECCKG